MKAFHSNPKIKETYLARVMAHQKADEIIQRETWDGKRGCAIGCTLHSYSHKAYETELGIPEWLAKLEDKLFEEMSTKYSKSWPADFLREITPGSDLNKIKIPFLIFIVESALERFDHEKYPKQAKAINGVLKELNRDKIDFDKLKNARATAATAAADADADAAADAAAAATAAAYAAVYAAAAAAAYAADADAAAAYAAYAAAYAAAGEKEYKKFADKLLELLKECK